MESERLWIALLAVVSFLAGGAGGMLLGIRMDPPGEPAPFEAFEARFAEAFDLEPQQRRDLRFILGRYRDDLEGLKERGLADREDELVQIGRTYQQLIRKWVLTEESHDEYDAMIAGAWPPAHSTPVPPTR
jgi:uncharacterized membrane protein